MVTVQPFAQGVHWFCVRTKPKKERAAASAVSSMLGLEIFCPQIRFRRKTVRGVVWFQEAMFPGYIFVRFDLSEMLRTVSHAPGVLNLPMFGNRYVPVPDEVIESLKQELDEEGSVDASVPLEVGDEATILNGSLQGLRVKVIKVMPARDRVAVLLELLGTLVEAEFPSEALESKPPHRSTDDG